jgi:branched-chain amino acid transport system permease protein
MSDPVLALVAVNLLLTLSLLFPFAAGVWSLGMSGFMAVGAYTAAFLTTEMGAPVWLAIPAGALAAMVSTVPVGLLTLRTRGVYLSIATLAEAELIILFFSRFEPTGAVMGMTGMPYIGAGVGAGLAVGALLLSVLVFRSRFGKVLVAVGSDPLIASCNAVNVPAVRAASLALSGILAGLAGGFFAHYYSFISPANFAASRVIEDLMFLVVGGLTPLGAAFGAVTLTLLPQVSARLETWAPAIYGIIVMATMALAPDGVFPKNRVTALLARLPGRRAQPRAATAEPTAGPVERGVA